MKNESRDKLRIRESLRDETNRESVQTLTKNRHNNI